MTMARHLRNTLVLGFTATSILAPRLLPIDLVASLLIPALAYGAAAVGIDLARRPRAATAPAAAAGTATERVARPVRVTTRAKVSERPSVHTYPGVRIAMPASARIAPPPVTVEAAAAARVRAQRVLARHAAAG